MAGKLWVVLELPTVWPGRGGGEDWVGEGVCARGERGIFPADLQRAERYWRCSFGDRPCRVLGRMWWDDVAGELGVLEAGELLCEEAPVEETETESVLALLSMTAEPPLLFPIIPGALPR